jgi:catechol-2,3-dioxygenase
MPVNRLNHAVLYVRDAARAAQFYADALDFTPIGELSAIPGVAFLRAPGSTNDHDLGLFSIGDEAQASPAGHGAVGLYHLAWEVDTLAELERIAGRLAELGALVGASDHSSTKSLYARDIDGNEFEVCWLVPADQLTTEVAAGRLRTRPLDLGREKERYGAQTRGGIGISVPAAV